MEKRGKTLNLNEFEKPITRLMWGAYRVSSLMFKRCHAVMGGGRSGRDLK